MIKTQYFSILKTLHDVCRNNPAPKMTGMDAYNEIINLLYLRHLSDNNNDVPDKYTLKYFYKNFCTDSKIEEDEKNNNYNTECSLSGIYRELNSEKLSKLFLPRLIKRDENKDIGFAKIMGNHLSDLKLDIGRLTNLNHWDKGDDATDGGAKLQKIINKIYSKGFLPVDQNNNFDIHAFPYDALGEGFEKFMKDAGSTGGNWGQYFTNQQVVNWVNNKLDIKSTDKIIDPFAGSGGFILNAKKRFNVKNENIYAQDTSDKIFKFLKFNTHIADIKSENITKGDSYDYTKFIKRNLGKFDKVITNPPFGETIDILLSVKDSPKTDFWKLMKSGKYTIKDSLGLGTFMIPKFLKKNGKAGFVVGQNILNNGGSKNSWEKRLRKHLIEDYKITDILNLPAGIFSHTNYATSCVILENSGKTDKINFHKGYFHSKEKGKGDKELLIKENFVQVSFKDLFNKEWSLNMENFIENKDDLINGVVYKTLGEVCEFKRGKIISKDTINKNKGIYPVIGGGMKPFGFYNKFNMNENAILVSQSGANAGYISKYDSKVWASDCFEIKFKNKKFDNKYLYTWLKLNENKFIKKKCDGGIQTGQAQPHVKYQDLATKKIPILPKDHQERIVENLDRIFNNDYQQLDSLVKTFKDYDLFLILLNENYQDLEQLKDLEQHIHSLNNILKMKETIGKKLYMKKCFFDVKGKMVPLGEVCEKDFGKRITKKDDGVSEKEDCVKYPVYGGGGITFHTKKYNREGETLIISRFGVSPKCVRIVSGNFWLNDSGFSLKNIKINQKYLEVYLLCNKNNIFKYASGNAQLNMQINKLFTKFKILVPSPEDQELVVKRFNKFEAKESEYIKSLETTKKELECMFDFVTVIMKENYKEAEDLTQKSESNKELESETKLTTETDSDDELEEVVYKEKTYLSDGEYFYRIKTNGERGKLIWIKKKGHMKKVNNSLKTINL